MINVIRHYYVPADKIGWTIARLGGNGFEWCGPNKTRIPISEHYFSATSRDWDGHKCIFVLDEYGSKRLLSITSDLLMKANSQESDIHSFDDLKSRYSMV